MAWTVTGAFDPGSTDFGSLTATWNAGLEDEYRFSARGSLAEIPKFVSDAKAGLTAWQSQRAVALQIKSTVEGMFNGTN